MRRDRKNGTGFDVAPQERVAEYECVKLQYIKNFKMDEVMGSRLIIWVRLNVRCGSSDGKCFLS